MTKFYITAFDEELYKPKYLSSLVKPFLDLSTGKWSDSPAILARRGCDGLNVSVVSELREADAVLVSEPLNHQHDRARYQQLEALNFQCAKRGIAAHAFISGDFGKVHPQFTNIFYYRLGGFKSELNERNLGFFPLISDQLPLLFNSNEIFVRDKGDRPKVGFCGHATNSIAKRWYEKAKFIRVNIQRAKFGDFQFEPLFSSAFERQKLLNRISQSDSVEANFITRTSYRAGARTAEDRRRTTIEYYNNIIGSDYVVCLRGGGNFSVRLYETLMMGRIPVFVNTDCLLPLENKIEWRKHVVWVEWDERKDIAQKITAHYRKLDQHEFQLLQLSNRDLWLNRLHVKEYLSDLPKANGS